jgi:hypothetical protein
MHFVGESLKMSKALGLKQKYTWRDAPIWWNPGGELIAPIEGEKVFIAYWRSPVNISDLEVVNS